MSDYDPAVDGDYVPLQAHLAQIKPAKITTLVLVAVLEDGKTHTINFVPREGDKLEAILNTEPVDPDRDIDPFGRRGLSSLSSPNNFVVKVSGAWEARVQ